MAAPDKEYELAGHVVQRVDKAAPVIPCAVPAGQDVHADAPELSWYWPAEQQAHAMAPAAEKVPTEHSSQPVDPELPWLDPAAQLEQALEPAAAEKAPAGQLRQLSACRLAW